MSAFPVLTQVIYVTLTPLFLIVPANVSLRPS
ncbi:hypothetical protein BLAT2472_50049 [Burkholderia latens]